MTKSADREILDQFTTESQRNLQAAQLLSRWLEARQWTDRELPTVPMFHLKTKWQAVPAFVTVNARKSKDDTYTTFGARVLNCKFSSDLASWPYKSRAKYPGERAVMIDSVPILNGTVTGWPVASIFVQFSIDFKIAIVVTRDMMSKAPAFIESRRDARMNGIEREFYFVRARDAILDVVPSSIIEKQSQQPKKPLVVCKCQLNSRDTWVESIDPKRPNDIMTRCSLCNKLIGYRPKDHSNNPSQQQSQMEHATNEDT